MLRLNWAIALGCLALPVLAATPENGTLTIHETELVYGEGPNVGVNPTPATADQTGLECTPGITCDRFTLTLDLPENLTEVFPSPILRINMTWVNTVEGVGEDYDLYAFNEAGDLLGSSGNDNTTPIGVGPVESITLGVRGGTTTIRIDALFFAVAGSTYTNTITLDLGPPSAQADVEQFFADNPPASLGFLLGEDVEPAAAEERSAAAAPRAGGLSGLTLLLLGILGWSHYRRQTATDRSRKALTLR